MSDPLRDMSGYIEQHGLLKIRDKGHRAELELQIQFDDLSEATKVGSLYRRKVYRFNDVWTVFFSGQKMFLWLMVARDFVCPAHRRWVTLAVQIHELNKKRRVLGDLQIKGKRPMRFKAACKEKSRTVAGVRARLFEELRQEQENLVRLCPVWVSLGPPHQRRLREWWAENRPAENEKYWKERGCASNVSIPSTSTGVVEYEVADVT